MTTVNRIIFTKKTFGSDEELYSSINRQIQLLIKANYIVIMYSADDKDSVICVEYSSRNAQLGNAYPYWLTLEEAQYISGIQEDIALEEHKKALEEAGYEVIEDESKHNDA